MKKIIAIVAAFLGYAYARDETLRQISVAPAVCPMDESSFANCNEIQTYNF
jgi:hypothetical protein